MAFSTAFLEELKFRNELSDVISQYVSLKRAGSNMVGLCPFHSERTPSFVVFLSTSSFHCFGCSAGGDVVSFVMQIEGLDYPGAIEFLARRCGIPLEEDSVKRSGIPRKRILELNKEAARFFHDHLMSPDGERALQYLSNRGIKPAAIKRFGIGASPSGWSALTEHMTKLGYNNEELTTAFLAGSKSGRTYDYFRNRVIFPIIDLNGNVVAFGGRAMGDEIPKYINTSDTPAFKKSRHLFALNFAKQHADEMLILCEGYMDVIALHQAGFPNAIATLGTAVTSEHARVISRFTKDVALVYDSDQAGRRATDRAINVLTELGISVKVLDLGNSKDPDDFIKKRGAGEFSLILKASKGRIDYAIGEILKKYNLSLPDDKQDALIELIDFIATIGDKPSREIYSNRAGELLGLSADGILKSVENRTKRVAKREKTKLVDAQIRKKMGYGDKINPERLKFNDIATIEERILGILLIRSELGIKFVKELSEDDFITEFSKRVYSFMKPFLEEGKEVIISKDGFFTPDEMGAISSMIASRLKLEKNDSEVLEADIKLLKEKKRTMELEEKVKEDFEYLGEYFEHVREKKQ